MAVTLELLKRLNEHQVEVVLIVASFFDSFQSVLFSILFRLCTGENPARFWISNRVGKSVASPPRDIFLNLAATFPSLRAQVG